MTPEPLLPLGSPPRKAPIRRGVRSLRRAYAVAFALVILVFGGWALLDAFHWEELTSKERALTTVFGLFALLALGVVQLVDHPLRRELRLARRGIVAQGQIRSLGKSHGRRARPTVLYTFRTALGKTIEGECALPRRFPKQILAVGTMIEVLYDPKNPHVNKPRLAMEFVDLDARTVI